MDKLKKDAPTCEYMHAHEDIINDVKEKMIDENSLYDLADLFKIFGDTTRIKILYVLSEHSMCVCDIATLLGISISAVSHQLKVLKTAKLVKYRRQGKTVFYSLSDDHVKTIINNGLEHINE